MHRSVTMACATSGPAGRPAELLSSTFAVNHERLNKAANEFCTAALARVGDQVWAAMAKHAKLEHCTVEYRLSGPTRYFDAVTHLHNF